MAAARTMNSATLHRITKRDAAGPQRPPAAPAASEAIRTFLPRSSVTLLYLRGVSGQSGLDSEGCDTAD
jgi:hypothetical protein